MKVVAIILAMATVALSSYPCCQETAQPSVEHGEQDHREAPCDTDSPCSPFYGCGRCPGFTVEYVQIHFLALDVVQVLPPVPYLESIPKEVHSVLFKPPRII